MRTRKILVSLAFMLALSLASTGIGLYAQTNISPPKFGQYTAGDDYFLGQLHAAGRVLGEAGEGIGPDEGGRDRQDLRGADDDHGDHHRAGQLQEARPLQGNLPAPGAGRGIDRRTGPGAGGRGEVGRLDRRRAARDRMRAGAGSVRRWPIRWSSRTDPETMRILNDDILLLVPVNPDGMDLVSNWYMREAEPTRRSTGRAAGSLQQVCRTRRQSRFLHVEPVGNRRRSRARCTSSGFPQIMYNQHQTGPAGSVLFMAPFRDPFNYNHDPLVPMGIDLVGSAIHNRFIAEGKPGAVMRGCRQLFDLVQRRRAHDHGISQSDRPPVGDHRQSDADEDPVRSLALRARTATSPTRSCRRSGISGSRSTT